MCGIVGYIGYRDVYPLLINGLKRLEYRGYDSAGIAILDDKAHIYKCKGKVSDLEKHINGTIFPGISEWAIPAGQPMVNPTISMHIPIVLSGGKFILIHNGIIENYAQLKERLDTGGALSLKVRPIPKYW